MESGSSLLDRHETLFRVSRAIGSYRDPKELFRVLAKELRQVVHFGFMGLFLYDEAANRIDVPVLEAVDGPGLTLPPGFPAEQTQTWWVYHHQQPVVVTCRDQETRFPQMMELFRQYNIQSSCVLPLTTARRRLGSLAFGVNHPHEYSDDEVRYLSLVADQVALAVDNALREEALKRSEAYLAEGQRLSHTGSWARNIATGEIYFSQESFRIFGLDPATCKPTLKVFLDRVHPDDRAAVEKAIQDTANDVRDYERDYRIILDDGTIRHIHAVGHPLLDESGTPVEFVGTHVDVTEQHRSRAALETAFDEIRTLKDQLFQENVALRQEIDETSMFEEIIGKSAVLQKLLKQVETVAPTDSTVLIFGETGTGKELIARAIHNLSSRRASAFVKLNCAAIPTGLLESELFGHEKGAFTGAIAQRIGRFELGNRGTVFLDEIGEVPLELQPKLLRVLQEREFERLGSNRTLHTDARLIAATNQDLEAMVGDHKFRSDLFYRLNVFPLHVPPLRQRPEDIPLLVRHFTEVFSRRINNPVTTIPSETMSALVNYDWPGNIRELQNVIERAVILSTRGVLRLSAADLKSRSNVSSKDAGKEPVVPKRRRAAVQPLARDQVVQALREAHGRVGGPDGAAARLGLKRTTLIGQMKRLGIEPREIAGAASA
jgi:formate hydrogenlyase transcriptional activator